MDFYPVAIEKLIEEFAKLPSIGQKTAQRLTLHILNLPEEEVVDPDDVEMLEDLVLSAINEALKKADEETSSKMGKLTGGLNIPGMF